MRWRIDTKEQAATVHSAILSRLDRFGKPLSVSIEDYAKPKTSPQVAKIHAMCRDVGISQGYDLELAKAVVKDKLGYVRFAERNDGTVITIHKSFAKATREEMSILIDRLYALAVEWGIELYD